MRFSPSFGAIVWIAAASAPVAPLDAQRTTVQPVTQVAPLVTLPAPAGLSVRNDPAVLVFSWQPVAGAVGYQIDAAPAVTGPWTSLVPAPIPSALFLYAPPAGTLTYYRVAAVHTLGNAGNPSIVPFIYNPPVLGASSASGAQSGSNLTVSWSPVTGATGYWVQVQTSLRSDQRQVFSPGTSAAFADLFPPGQNSRYANFTVDPQFPRGVAGAMPGKRASTSLPAFDPSVCWPAGETPGGPAPATLAATPMSNTVQITWIPVGQVLAYRVERAPAGSGKWESLACLGLQFPRPFIDQSIALRPLTAYDYRVTDIGPGGVAGASIATIVTPAPPVPIVGASVHTSSYNGGGPTLVVDLSVPVDESYRITSSYGYEGFEPRGGAGRHRMIGVPSGKHFFTVTRVYQNGLLGGGTTVAVTVP